MCIRSSTVATTLFSYFIATLLRVFLLERQFAKMFLTDSFMGGNYRTMDKPTSITSFSTKITAPMADNPVLRTLLFQRLDQFRNKKIVWLSGPPGSGKTTLASTYLFKHVSHHLWYQLNLGDVKIVTFFHYFRLAIQQAAQYRCQKPSVLAPESLPDLVTFIRSYAEPNHRPLSQGCDYGK